QYICHTCSSIIAEYREFQKPDVQRDVGSARSLTPDYGSTITPPAETTYTPPTETTHTPPTETTYTPPTETTHTPPAETTYTPPAEPSFSQPPSDEPPLTMPTFDEPTSVSEPSIPEIQTQPIDSTFNSISGMAVIDENAKKIGTSKQVAIDSSQNVVLVITNNEGNDVTVPWNKIRKIGEVILLGSSSEITASQSENCSSCNYNNKIGSKFCEQCGGKL
ncbi:MAG TPA: hypothetical protein ENH95_06940, partial [Nitrosopumilus sp.]|nr:hypothetical protein [Nitrosopumilus sp.]